MIWLLCEVVVEDEGAIWRVEHSSPSVGDVTAYYSHLHLPVQFHPKVWCQFVLVVNVLLCDLQNNLLSKHTMPTEWEELIYHMYSCLWWAGSSFLQLDNIPTLVL